MQAQEQDFNRFMDDFAEEQAQERFKGLLTKEVVAVVLGMAGWLGLSKFTSNLPQLTLLYP